MTYGKTATPVAAGATGLAFTGVNAAHGVLLAATLIFTGYVLYRLGRRLSRNKP